MNLQEQINSYRQAGMKAIDYTTGFQQPDGGYIWDGYVDNAFHKQGYSWILGGRFTEAHRLMDWVKANRLMPDGQLKNYLGDVYKTTWLALSAQRLGRFDVSYPVWNYLLSLQAPSGGFPRYAHHGMARTVSTGLTGIAALNFGNVQVARQAAQFCIDIFDRQPEDGRFYCYMTHDGQVVTENDDPPALFVDKSLPKQIYYELGVPMLLLCNMHLATGEAVYLEYAKKYFESHISCHEDNMAFVFSGKSALAAAMYYQFTGDERGRDAAMAFCDFCVETQLPNGSWIDRETDPDELLYYVDHAACFTVWLMEIATILESKDAMTPVGAS